MPEQRRWRMHRLELWLLQRTVGVVKAHTAQRSTLYCKAVAMRQNPSLERWHPLQTSSNCFVELISSSLPLPVLLISRDRL